MARPSTPEAVRDDIFERASAGEAISFTDIQREVGGEKPTADPMVGLVRQAAQLAEERPDDPLVGQLIELVAQMAKRGRSEAS